AFLYGTGIGLATIVAGWHRPSDVVGGMLVATAWAAGTVAVVAHADPEVFGRERAGMRATLADTRRLVLVAAAVAAAAWLLADAIVLGTDVGRLDLSHADLAFAWACAAIVTLAASVFAWLLLALRPALSRRAAAPAL
ncbi:MAG TPA: hypothetical protein VI318_08560, partial [Baekduia sp.]